MSFKDLKLSKPLLRAVAEAGYDNPTLVQEKTIPLILDILSITSRDLE